MTHAPTGLVVVALIVVMFLWGGSFIAIKIGLRHLTPLELVFARFVPSALLLLPIGLWTAGRRRPGQPGFWRSLSRRERRLVLLAAFLAVPAYHFCLNLGETLIPAGWASLVISLNPACIVVFAALLLREPIGARRWVGIAIAFAGLLVITLNQDAPTGDGVAATRFQKALGLIITLGAVISWGSFTTLSKRLIAGREPLEALAWIITLGAVLSLPALHPGLAAKMVAGGAELAWVVVFLSVGCTVIGFAVWFWALNQWPASKAGAFIYLVPLFALAIGRVVLNEPVTAMTLVGATGVLGGVLLAATGRARDN